LGTLFSAALVVCLVLLADVEASAEEGTVTAASAPVRIRLGASAGVGLGSMGLAGAASARAGVQITPSLAVSYQITAAATALFDEDSWISHALFFETVVPGTMFSIGGGPSIVSGTVTQRCIFGSDCTPPPSSQSYLGPGFDGRLAYTFGTNRPTIRGGFTLELAVHVSPKDTLVVAGIGFDVF